MKKKIFITGATREYDSANPNAFAEGIEDYIKTNLVTANCADAINVSVTESVANELTIKFNFGTGREIDTGMISREMYRCFTGECATFSAQYSIYWSMNFGTAYPMNVQFRIQDTIDAHKKNTNFYKASRYKTLAISETASEMIVKIKF